MTEYINNGWTKILSVKDLKEYLEDVPDFFDCPIEVRMLSVLDKLENLLKEEDE